jgi:hypothetical protein
VRHDSCAQIVLGDAKSDHVLGGQVHPSLGEIGRDVANDVGELQRHPEVHGVGARAGVAVAEDLDADQANRRGDAAAVLRQRMKGRITRLGKVHLHAIDQILEGLPRQAEFTDVRLQGLSLLRRRLTPAVAGVHLIAPHRQCLGGGSALSAIEGRNPPCVNHIHRIVDSAAEIPDCDDRAALPRRQDEK